MASEVGVAFVRLLPSMKGFGPEVRKGMSGPAAAAGKDAGRKSGRGFVGAFGGGLKGIGGVLAGAFAVKGIVNVVGGAISAASDLGEEISKVGVIFGTSQDQVLGFAETAAKSIGISRVEALQASGVFGNLFTGMGIGQKEAAGMSTEMVKLAGDMASFNNASPEETLAAIQSGLVGEVEPLRRFGVLLSAAAVEEKAMALGLADSAGALTEADKAQARYALILEQTTAAQGDFERTSGSLANQQRSLGAQWSDLQATLGQQLLPVATAAVGAFSGFLDVATGIGNWIGDNSELFIALGIGIGAVLIPAFVGWAASAAAAAAATIAAAAPVIAIGAVIAGVAFVIIKNWDSIKRFTISAWKTVTGFVSNAWDTIRSKVSGGISAVVGFVRGLGGRISSAARGAWDGLWNAFRGAINRIIRGWNNLSFTLPRIDTIFGTVGGWTLSTPNIPLLGRGGVVTAPTLAVLGERGEDEAVMPLDRLRGMVADVAAAASAPAELNPSFDVRVFLGDRELKDLVGVEITERDRAMKQRLMAGSGTAR